MAVILVCLVAGSAVAVVQNLIAPERFVAQSSIVAIGNSSSSGTILSLVETLAENASHEPDWRESKVDFEVDRSSSEVQIEAWGKSEDEAVALANSFADSVTKRSDAELAQLEDDYFDSLEDSLASTFTARGENESGRFFLDFALAQASLSYGHATLVVKEAAEAKGLGFAPFFCFRLVGSLLIGMFLAVCLLLLWELVRKPIRLSFVRSAMPEGSFAVEVGDKRTEDLLYLDVISKCGGHPASLCLLPIGLGDSAHKICGALERLLGEHGVSCISVPSDDLQIEDASNLASARTVLIAGKPFLQSSSGIAASREAQATIVCAQEWVDREEDLDKALSELGQVGSNVIGMTLCVCR